LRRNLSKFVTQTGLYCSKQLETTFFIKFCQKPLQITFKAEEAGTVEQSSLWIMCRFLDGHGQGRQRKGFKGVDGPPVILDPVQF